MNKKEIQLYLNKVNKKIDYKEGDWVETCNLLPGIVQKIYNYFDNKPERMCFVDDVLVYYPHYTEIYPNYNGNSSCSITDCGVHKISKDYAKMLFALGYDKLRDLWCMRNYTPDDKPWDEIVKEAYNELSNNEKKNGIHLFNIGEEYSKKIKK